MGTWEIVLIVYCVASIVAFVKIFFEVLLSKEKFTKENILIIFGSLFIIPILIIIGLLYLLVKLLDWLTSTWYKIERIYRDGGIIQHYKLSKEEEKYRLQREAEEKEYKRIKSAYQNGELTEAELPRVEDGIKKFEFKKEMGLYVDESLLSWDLVYVENEYCESLNRFFIEHKGFRPFRMYKYTYLPNLCEDVNGDEIYQYFYPGTSREEKREIHVDSMYPLQFLWYPEDAQKFKHGMVFFKSGMEKYGQEYIRGQYYELEEGSDESIIAQLETIARAVNEEYRGGCFYCKARKPEWEEGSTEEYADGMFNWVLADDEVSGLIDEVRERIKKLKEYGIGKKLLLTLLDEKPKLSRLVITQDMRILLPDYNNMEIKLEPINKAVYLLFLRHPEGIMFKYLPDYRKELAEIYQKIKPFGLNDRALRSIEDVTNPCLNSINEKCARIRGVFISQFDSDLAYHYCIYGMRGEAKKISLPRDLVIWE